MSSGIVVRRIGPAAYAALGPAFAELARNALEPNPHMAPAAVSAATLLAEEADILVLCAWYSEALDFERLVGVWALRRARDWRSGFAGVLIAPVLPVYEVSSLPVVDRDRAVDASDALMRYLLAANDLPRTLSLPLLPLEGPGHAALAEACRVTGSTVATCESWARPVMIPQPGDDAERYLRRALGSAYKKRMQQFRAATKSGALTFRRSRGQAAIEALDTFLALEASGWKGKAGTAIACIPEDTAYFRRLAALFAAEDGLVVDALLLDGRILAMGLLIESAGRRHFLKIAYDETQARHSPGRTLTIAMLRADLAGTPPDLFDSGAGDGVDAGTYVWGERRMMGHVLVGIGRSRIGLPLAAALSRMGLRTLRRLWRARSAKAASARAPA